MFQLSHPQKKDDNLYISYLTWMLYGSNIMGIKVLSKLLIAGNM